MRLICPPVNVMSPLAEIRARIAELERELVREPGDEDRTRALEPARGWIRLRDGAEAERVLLELIDEYLAARLELAAFSDRFENVYIDDAPADFLTDRRMFFAAVNERATFVSDKNAGADGLMTEAEFRSWLEQELRGWNRLRAT